MANNLLWLRKRYPSEKIVIWCHNFHAQLGEEPYRNGNLRYTGYYIHQRIKGVYKAFAFQITSGTAAFYQQGKGYIYALEAPVKDCYEYYLNKINYPVLF